MTLIALLSSTMPELKWLEAFLIVLLPFPDYSQKDTIN